MGFNQHRGIDDVFAIPGEPGLQDLNAVALGVYVQLNVAAVLGRRNIIGIPLVELFGRNLVRRLGRLQLKGIAVGAGKGILQWVE